MTHLHKILQVGWSKNPNHEVTTKGTKGQRRLNQDTDLWKAAETFLHQWSFPRAQGFLFFFVLIDQIWNNFQCSQSWQSEPSGIKGSDGMQFKKQTDLHWGMRWKFLLSKTLPMYILCMCVFVCVCVYAQKLCQLGHIIWDCFPNPTDFSLSQISNYCFSCKQLSMLKW